jgi:hypothetical protein
LQCQYYPAPWEVPKQVLQTAPSLLDASINLIKKETQNNNYYILGFYFDYFLITTKY